MKKLLTTFAAALAASTMTMVSSPAHAGTDPYLGEIMLVGFQFCPRGWTEANGQLLSISTYQALFSLYGTLYGGDGRTDFALPNLEGRMAMHTGTGPGLSNRPQGEKGGSETISVSQMPSHNHRINTTEETPDTHDPNNAIFATFPGNANAYSTNGAIVHQMRSDVVSNTGGTSQKLSPFLVLRYCVSLEGIYPSRN